MDMHSKSFRLIIKESMMKLVNPNEFEIYEYAKDVYSKPNLDRSEIKYILKQMQNLGEIVKCPTRSSNYSKRYSLDKTKPRCKIDPMIFRKIKERREIIKIAKDVNDNNKKISINGIMFIPDPIRDVVFAVKENSLMGVIDLRYYHRPKNEIRFPTRFYRQQSYEGMTELRYFSRIIFNKKINCWLSVNKWRS